MNQLQNIDFSDVNERLKHVYFINGTAYAGKSTICKMLAKNFHMFLCEENYHMNDFLEQTNPSTHPNLHYFTTMSGWEEFVTRDKYTYVKWLEGTAIETTPLEIEYLLSLPNDKLVIVDTNIPHDVLIKISDPKRIAYMVTTPEISRDEFFNRLDREKQFLLSVIEKTDHPEENLQNYKDILLYANRQEVIDRFTKSGIFYTMRKTIEDDIYQKYDQICKHFEFI
ncbi:MAG: hypothetical protein AB7U79_02365 [Candidatus Izemoplasmatales bacterium]